MTSRGGKVVARFLVGLFVEAHNQMFEQIPHLKVVDMVGVQVHICHTLDDGEQAVARVQFFDLVAELEFVENPSRRFRKPVDVGDQIRGDVFRIIQQSSERKRAGVVEGVLALRVRSASKQPVHCVFRHVLRDQPSMFLQHSFLRRFKDTVQAAQDHHGQHHQTVLWWPIRAAKTVGDIPDVGFELVMKLYVHVH